MQFPKSYAIRNSHWKPQNGSVFGSWYLIHRPRLDSQHNGGVIYLLSLLYLLTLAPSLLLSDGKKRLGSSEVSHGRCFYYETVNLPIAGLSWSCDVFLSIQVSKYEIIKNERALVIWWFCDGNSEGTFVRSRGEGMICRPEGNWGPAPSLRNSTYDESPS